MMLFGASDYTARVSAAIFGSALVLTPLLLRRKLGTIGTLAAMAFLAFSPTLVYYSRFFREDIYLALFSLLMVAAMWRYIEEGRNRWLVLLAGSFLGGILTKEGGFITTAVFLVYLDLYLAADLAKRTLIDRDDSLRAKSTGEDGSPGPQYASMNTPFRRTVLTLGLAPWAWAVAALWPFLGRLRTSMGWDNDLPRAGDLLVILGTFTLPLLTPVSRHYLLEPLGIIEVDRLGWNESFQSGVNARDSLALVGLFAITTSISAFAGLQWKPKLWAITFLVGSFVYLTLMTSLWTNLHGMVSGPWGSLDYWITQQDEARGNQPWFYYYMLVAMYEFLPIALCIAGAWWMVVRGDAFTRLAGFLARWHHRLRSRYSSEKMPWNNAHITLPGLHPCGAVVSRAFDAWNDGTPGAPQGASSSSSVAAIARRSSRHSPPSCRSIVRSGSVRGGILIAAAGIDLVRREAVWPPGDWGSGSRRNHRWRSRSSPCARWFSPSTNAATCPRTCSSTPRARQTSRRSRRRSTRSRRQQAWDSTCRSQSIRDDSFSWPWAWYLRDYKRVAYVSFANGIPDGDYAVLLVNSSNNYKVRDDLATTGDTRYSAPAEYPHRWWFDERYKAADANRRRRRRMHRTERELRPVPARNLVPHRRWRDVRRLALDVGEVLARPRP